MTFKEFIAICLICSFITVGIVTSVLFYNQVVVMSRKSIDFYIK